jgi:hypothetical protein
MITAFSVWKLYRLLKIQGIGILDLEWLVHFINIRKHKIPKVQK